MFDRGAGSIAASVRMSKVGIGKVLVLFVDIGLKAAWTVWQDVQSK
jgi:hypothetical protein